jgi:hypothetical protein
MSLRLTQHHFALHGEPIPPVDESLLLDYIVGSNGVYARGRRPGLEVCMPVSFNLQPVRGLRNLESYVQWGWPKVPLLAVMMMLGKSRRVCEYEPREALFHLSFGDGHDEFEQPSDHIACAKGWHLIWPEQKATAESVIAVETGAGTSTERAIIELHSHHSMRAEFSSEDNKDESQGFRVYAVIGEIFTQPKIRARVGLFGHLWEFAASEFFELPEGLDDCVKG